MKKLTRPFAGPLAILAAGVAAGLIFSGFAAAQTTTSDARDAATVPAPIVVHIENSGEALVRGIVTDVQNNLLILESWGGSWTLTLEDNGTIFSGGAQDNTLDAISVGDFVGAVGSVSSNDTKTIRATFIRNWSTDPFSLGTGLFENPLSQTDGSQSGEPQTSAPGSVSDTSATQTEPQNGADISGWSGTIDSASDTSFTYTDDHGITYTVEVENAVVTTENNELLERSELGPGDDVTIDGTVSGTAIEASRVTVDTRAWPF